MREEILRMENVSKTVKGIIYLDNINFHIFKGEIMGLLPLNNHGKDKLIQLISQNTSIDFGRIYFNENLVNYYEYSSMTYNKVYTIDKETQLVEDLNVIDNIYVLNNNFDGYIIRQKKIKNKVDKLIEELELNIETNQLVSQLSIFEKSAIQLIKAVATGAKLIILDEISNFLGLEELLKFQNLVRYYTEKGISFLYMANHHEEAFQICHRASLFENGKIVKIIEKEDFSDKIMKPYIIKFDTGMGISSNHTEKSFRFKNFVTKNLKRSSFSVGKGECITILDVDNKGIQDIEQILEGKISPSTGQIVVNDNKMNKVNPYNLLVNKVAFIPENPIEEALFYDMSYMGNLTFLMDYKLKSSIVKDKILKGIEREYKPLVGSDIKEKDIKNLGSRSLYYLVYYRVLLFNPNVVFIVQPFSNADMYLRNEIIKLINNFKENDIGVVILAVSISDTLYVSDKLLVMKKGIISQEIESKYFFKT